MHTLSLPLGERLLSGLCAGYSKKLGYDWFSSPQSMSASAQATVLF